MAFAYIGQAGSLQNKNASTANGASITPYNAGELIVVLVAKDNAATVDQEGSEVVAVRIGTSGTTGGQLLTKAREYTNGQGAAKAGATGALWYGVAEASGSEFNVEFSSATDAKAATVFRFSIGSNVTVELQQAASQAQDGTTPASFTLSFLPQRDYLFIRMVAQESNASGAWTPTSGYSNMAGTQTSGGGSASNMGVRGEYAILSQVTESTSAPTGGDSADHVTAMVALYEATTATPKAGTDTAAGADASTATHAATRTEGNTSTELATGAYAATGAEAGVGSSITATVSELYTVGDAAGSDEVSLGTYLPVVAVGGAGTDVAAGTATLGQADVATGADAGQVTQAHVVADSGAGAEVAAHSESYGATDAGAGADAGTPEASLPRTDAAVATEAPATTGAEQARTEAGTGTEAGSAVVATSGTDSGAGQDQRSPDYATLLQSLQPIAYWRLGDTGATASDAMGAHPGSYIGSPERGVQGALLGDPDTAARFSGVGQYVRVPHHTALNPTSAISMLCWAKVPPTLATTQALVAKGATNQYSYEMRINGSSGLVSGLVFQADGAAQKAATGTIDSRDDKWHLYVATWDGTTMRVYRDGVANHGVTSGSMSAWYTGSTANLNIAGRSDGGNLFAGGVDEAALWGRVLSADEIAALYRAGTAPAGAYASQIESGTTVEVVAAGAATGAADAGGALEVGSGAADVVAGADTGTGTDFAHEPATAVTGTEASTATEATLQAATTLGQDAAGAADASVQAGSQEAADTASGTEAPATLQAAGTSVDTGAGADLAFVGTEEVLTVGDSGTGAELVSTTGAMAAVQAGTGAEELVLAGALAGLDTGAGADAGSFAVTGQDLIVGELGSGADAIYLLAPELARGDTGAGTDAATKAELGSVLGLRQMVGSPFHVWSTHQPAQPGEPQMHSTGHGTTRKDWD